jgi:hypothetical protein
MLLGVTDHAQVEPAGRTLRDKDVVCLGHLKRVFDLLGPLHDVGCARDRAGNRELFFDDYVKLVLLYVWNPLIQSVHDLQQAAMLPRVAKTLGVKRFSAGSFSESVRVFDPEQLKPVIAELASQLKPYAKDPRLADLKHVVTLVDGTVLRGLARLVKAAVGRDARYNTARDGTGLYGWRLHTQLDLDSFTPHRIDRTGARNAGENRESNVLRATLEAGRCYVNDGGYFNRDLFDQIVDAGSSFVSRAAETSVCEVIEERLLSQEALDAGVARDAVVRLNGTGTKQSDLIVLYTDMMEPAPELVTLIYSKRYTVELFFRVFKQLLGLHHLLSQRQEGIDIQIYCTVIVCLLIQIISGKKPNKAMRNIVGWYLLGLADEQDVLNFLNKPDNTGVKKRAKEELWKKLGY